MQLAHAMRRIAVFLQALLTGSAFATRPSGRFDFLNSANNLTSAVEYNSSQIPKFSKMDGLNPVLATATEIQSLLENGAITSVQLIDTFLAQIKKHNRAGLELRALSSVPSRELLLARAEMLDKERSAGKTRSPFHGIPITLKDAIVTDLSLGMSSEVGSYAFRDAVPKQSAEIVDVLLERGLIIIGKASLTEFCGQKGQGVKTGWSATNGQSQSAYVKGGVAKDDLIYGYTTPGGSSSGSAIGVSAGFTPLSCGTEHDGSAIGPANRAALYAVKMTHGSVSTKGVFRITSSMDCLAGMAKSTADLALLLEMMLTEEARKHLPADGYKSALVHSWDGISIGFVDPSLWRLPASICPPDEDSIAQQEAAIHAAMKKMSDLGARVVYPVELPPYSDFDFDTVSDYEFTETYPEFTSNFKEPPAKNLAELIEFNKQHADLELPADSPSQSFLEDALNSRITSEDYTAAKAQMRKLGGPDGIDRAMGEHQVDVIVAPSHSPISGVSAAAGYPIATVPLGMIEKYNVPFGISIVSTAFAEDKLLRFMSAFEATFPQRTPPSMLQEEHASL